MTVKVSQHLLRGGIDLVSAFLSTDPGRSIDSLNYEAIPTGGYQRISGYKGYDGANGDTPVPGVGPVRGVGMFEGVAYAVRDQDAGSAALFRATGGGWAPVPLGQSMRFDSGRDVISEGEIVTGQTSGATARVRRFNYGGGLIDSESVFGTLTVDMVTGAFVEDEGIMLGGSRVAEVRSAVVANTLPAGGRYRFFEHNFFGQAGQGRLYVANGISPPFEYDGDIAAFFETGASQHPFIVLAHKDHLFLGYRQGSIVNSSTTDPLEFNALTGASEIAVGDTLTDLYPLSGGTLAIGCRDSIKVLYGNDSETWQPQQFANNGAREQTMREIGGKTLLLDDRGVLELGASQSFGDFSSVSVSRDLGLDILTLSRSRGEGVALTNYAKSQYRLFFGNVGYYFTYNGPKMVGVMPVLFAHPVRCAISGENALGNATSFFGSDDGFVYELDQGNFFAGQPLPSRLQLAFNHLGSPTSRKRYRRAVFDCKVFGQDATIYSRALFDLGAGPSTVVPDEVIEAGAAAFYGAAIFDEARYAEPLLSRLNVDCEGYGEAMSILLIHEGVEDTQFSIFSYTLHYSLGRLGR